MAPTTKAIMYLVAAAFLFGLCVIYALLKSAGRTSAEGIFASIIPWCMLIGFVFAVGSFSVLYTHLRAY